MLVFDVTRRDTFLVAKRFLEDVRYNAEPDCVIYLVGNKMDLVQSGEATRNVTSEEAKSFANENKLYYIETSAYSDYKVNEAFEGLIESII